MHPVPALAAQEAKALPLHRDPVAEEVHRAVPPAPRAAATVPRAEAATARATAVEAVTRGA
jgi:hypothetical protein